MNILFLFVSLQNLSNDTALFTSLIHEFKNHGHNVLVSSRDNDNKSSSEVIIENGIRVLRVKSHPFTGVSNPIKKALAYQEYSLKQRYLVKKYFGNEKIDLIISHSLPPELAWIASGLKRHFKCPFFLIQSDYTWQDAVALGYFGKNNPVCLYYRFWENLIMKQADYIGGPTKGNVDFILKHYPNTDLSKFTIMPFWQKPIEVQGISDLKEKDPSLKDKFVVVYGGSIGAAQRIEHLVELAEATLDVKDIVYLILGRGAYLPVIKKMVEEKGLDNVVFKEFLPQNEYLSLLSSCDVGMIILHEKTGMPNFPSKTMGYLNMKVPVLAALDYVTDFGTYLEENKAGLWAHSDDIPALNAKLMTYYNDRKLWNEIRQKGYELFMNELQPVNAYNKIMSAINKK